MIRIFFLALMILTFNSYSQILEPVKWDAKSNKISDNEYEITFTAIIDNGWYIYSQNIQEYGPTPTVFTFDKKSNFKIIGKLSEEKGEEYYDKVFKMKIKHFKGKTIFKQLVKKNTIEKILIVGYIEFSSCRSGQCVMGSYDFEIEI